VSPADDALSFLLKGIVFDLSTICALRFLRVGVPDYFSAEIEW